jgi:hypothetical protein
VPFARRLELPARTAVAVSSSLAFATIELEADRTPVAASSRVAVAVIELEADRTAVAASSRLALATSELEADRTAVAVHVIVEADGNPWLTKELERYHVLLG